MGLWLGGSRLRRTMTFRRRLTLACAAIMLALALATAGSGVTIVPVSFAHPYAPMAADAATDRLADGGFEQSPSAWHQYSRGGYGVIASAVPHSGSFHFYACGYPNCDDRVWQGITAPGAVHSAILSFWVASSLAPFNLSGVCRDHLTVQLEAPDTSFATTLWTLCHPTLGYTLVQVDVTVALAAYAGQPLMLAFRGTTANLASVGRGYSFWFVDDVSLSVS